MAKFAVIGLGKFGMNVATTLFDKGAEVIAIDNNRLVLGTWQGIFFCEFDGPRTRKVQVRIIKEKFQE